jgi:hypothetical protein
MRRLHLFEFMDLKWYPDILRKLQTNILQVIMTRTTAFDYAIPYIDSIMEKANTNKIIDLCSGASGPWLRLVNKLKDANAQIVLTDKYPNIEMFKIIKKQTKGKIDFIEHPIDALEVSETIPGIRTIFTGFHHFKQAEVKKLLRDAQDKNQALCIFDYVPNKMLTVALFPVTFIISLLQFYFVSFLVRPLSFKQVLFTNIIPLVPIASAWDGFVSALRKYDAGELKEIVNSLSSPDYKWEVGTDTNLSKAVPLTYLIGLPKNGGKAM